MLHPDYRARGSRLRGRGPMRPESRAMMRIETENRANEAHAIHVCSRIRRNPRFKIASVAIIHANAYRSARSTSQGGGPRAPASNGSGVPLLMALPCPDPLCQQGHHSISALRVVHAVPQGFLASRSSTLLRTGLGPPHEFMPTRRRVHPDPHKAGGSPVRAAHPGPREGLDRAPGSARRGPRNPF